MNRVQTGSSSIRFLPNQVTNNQNIDGFIPSINSLIKITNHANFTSLAPKLKFILEALDEPDENILNSLNENIIILQDAFIDALLSIFSYLKIEYSHKITLGLDVNDKLILLIDHTKKVELEQLFEHFTELSKAFKEIALQSEILRDINNIGNILSKQLNNTQLAKNYLSKNKQYKISIIGEMSHFYFS